MNTSKQKTNHTTTAIQCADAPAPTANDKMSLAKEVLNEKISLRINEKQTKNQNDKMSL